jgi:hypothetical protein
MGETQTIISNASLLFGISSFLNLTSVLSLAYLWLGISSLLILTSANVVEDGIGRAQEAECRSLPETAVHALGE